MIYLGVIINAVYIINESHISMSDPNIKKYIDKFFQSEGMFSSDNPSNEVWRDYGRILDENTYLTKLIQKQRELIKSLSKQEDTDRKYGFKLRWAEFKNSVWRKIIGVDQSRLFHMENFEANKTAEFIMLCEYFTNYCSKIFSSGGECGADISGFLYFDVTSSLTKDYTTGIQRAVFEIGRELIGFGATPVFLHEEEAYSLNFQNGTINEVLFKKNDILLLLDHSWDINRSVAQVIKKNKSSGGFNIVVLYDIIPMLYPQFFDFPAYYLFHRWVETIANSDLILCISPAVANDLKNYFLMHNKINYPSIEYFSLGSNFSPLTDNFGSGRLDNLLNNEACLFLSVGTLEPRKGYSVAIDAVESAWALGQDLTYVIIGRVGRFQEKLIERILKHKEYGHRLFWFSDLDDADLSLLYKKARALIYPSVIEGYGLPLVEAARYGLPSIVSDIAVFRSIAGDQATYFDVADKKMLAEKLVEACESEKIRPEFPIISWRESKDLMMKHILNFTSNRVM